MARNQDWFNLPNMLAGPSNFFGPEGPADPTGLARDFRYQRHLTAIARLHPVRLFPPTPPGRCTKTRAKETSKKCCRR